MTISLEFSTFLTIYMVFGIAIIAIIITFIGTVMISNSLEEQIGKDQQELAKNLMQIIDREMYHKYQEIQVISDANPIEGAFSLKDDSVIE